MAYTGILTTAAISDLEKETLSTFAQLIIVEKEAQQTAAVLATHEIEAYGPFAHLSDLEAPGVSTLSFISSLEREAISSLSVISSIEKVGRSVFACLSDLVYVIAPTEASTKILDIRESPKRPVASAKVSFILPIGQLSQTARFKFNAQIKQVTFKTPALDSGTAKIQLFDKIGAMIWESGNQAQSVATALISTDIPVPIDEEIAVKVIASKTQATAVSFIVVIYGV